MRHVWAYLAATFIAIFSCLMFMLYQQNMEEEMTPHEILAFREDRKPKLINEYIVLMKDGNMKKFVDADPYGTVDEVWSPDLNEGWAEEFKIAKGKILLGSRSPEDYCDDKERATAMFNNVLKLTVPSESFPKEARNKD